MSWVKVGRWIFRIQDVVVLENRVDGTDLRLQGGHGVRLNKAETTAFLQRFKKDVAIEDLGVVQDSLVDVNRLVLVRVLGSQRPGQPKARSCCAYACPVTYRRLLCPGPGPALETPLRDDRGIAPTVFLKYLYVCDSCNKPRPSLGFPSFFLTISL